MGAEVVGAREALGAKIALECGRVFLYASRVVFLTVVGPSRIGEIEKVFAVRIYRGCRGAPHLVGGWGRAARTGLIGAIKGREGPVAMA